MKAAVYHRYGPPEVVGIEEIAMPTPADDEVLVRVHATTVTPADWRFRKPQPWIIRLMNGLARPTKCKVLGTELAGVVESVGGKVTRYKPGDWVFGDVAFDGMGAHAEYKCVPESGKLAATPPNVSHEQAATLCFGGLSALYFLRDVARVQPGERVLINGAAGGVGSFLVQLAKYFDAHVTGVCGSTNLDTVRSLGADEVIDYTAGDPLAADTHYDVLLDTVGVLPMKDSLRALSPNGRLVPICYGPWPMLLGLKNQLAGGKPIRCDVAKGSREDVELLGHLLETDAIRTVIDRRYPLTEIAEAHRYVEAGHKRGSVVIEVVDPSDS